MNSRPHLQASPTNVTTAFVDHHLWGIHTIVAQLTSADALPLITGRSTVGMFTAQAVPVIDVVGQHDDGQIAGLYFAIELSQKPVGRWTGLRTPVR